MDDNLSEESFLDELYQLYPNLFPNEPIDDKQPIDDGQLVDDKQSIDDTKSSTSTTPKSIELKDSAFGDMNSSDDQPLVATSDATSNISSIPESNTFKDIAFSDLVSLNEQPQVLTNDPTLMTNIPRTTKSRGRQDFNSNEGPKMKHVKFGTPSYSSPPSTSSKCYDGYIHSVSPMHQSQKSSNLYFDVSMQTSENEYTQLRVMKQRGDGSKRQLFIDKMESQQPVNVSNTKAVSSGTVFFNKGSVIADIPSLNFKYTQPLAATITKIFSLLEQYNSGLFTVSGIVSWKDDAHPPNPTSNKMVRDGVITDISGSITLSIWQEHIDQVQENQFYTITNCNLRHYYGKCLATTKSSTIKPAEDQNVSDISQESIVNTFICCPDILNISVNTYPICNIQICRKKINPTPGAKCVRCLNCNRDMLLENAYVDMNTSFHLHKKDKTYSVTAFSKVINNFCYKMFICIRITLLH